VGIGPLSVPWNVPSQICRSVSSCLGCDWSPATFECEPSLIQQPAFAVHFRLMVGHASSQSRKRTARLNGVRTATHTAWTASDQQDVTQNSRGQTSATVNSLKVGASQHQARRSQPDLRRWNGRERSAFRPPEAVPDRSCGGLPFHGTRSVPAHRPASRECHRLLEGVSPTFGSLVTVTEVWKLLTVTDVWKDCH
jgi:hypothetical protein